MPARQPTELPTEVVDIDTLTPDPQNARRHSEKNLRAIAGSLRQFGQRRPIVVASGNGGESIIIAGNGTVEAARSLGWSKIIVTRVPRSWSHDKARAFALADNRTAELAEWDENLLATQLIDLDAEGWSLDEIGFESLNPPEAPDFDPISVDEQPRLDERISHVCPHCDMPFVMKNGKPEPL